MKSDVSGIKGDIKALKKDQEKHFTALKIDLDSVQGDVVTLKSDVHTLKSDLQRVERIATTTLEIVKGERDERINLDGRVGILEEDVVMVKEKVGLKEMNAGVAS